MWCQFLTPRGWYLYHELVGIPCHSASLRGFHVHLGPVRGSYRSVQQQWCTGNRPQRSSCGCLCETLWDKACSPFFLGSLGSVETFRGSKIRCF